MKPANQEPTKPPSGLSEAAVERWKSVVTKPLSPGRAALLEQAVRCLDRLEQVQTILATETLTVTTERTKAVHVHPLLKVETELRRQFATIWATLGLQFNSTIDGRNG